jgi:peroxiredoxin
LPRLQPLYDTYHDQGFEVVAVERKRDTERAQTFIREHHLTYTFLQDGEGDQEVVRRVYGVRSFPTSYLIDRSGRIMYVHVGFEPGDEVEIGKQIEKLL